LVGKPEGKTLLGRCRCIWKYNIKMNFRKIYWDGMNWSHLAENREQCRALLTPAMGIRVP
jgi:hypothetical protein